MRVDRKGADLLGSTVRAAAQAEVGPGLAGVSGLVDAVAGGEVRALQAFAAGDVDGVGIGVGNSDRADGAGGLVVPEADPGLAGVGGLPDAAVDRAEIEGGGLGGNPGEGAGAAGAQGADLPPAHVAEEVRVDLGGSGGDRRESEEGDAGEPCRASGLWHLCPSYRCGPELLGAPGSAVVAKCRRRRLPSPPPVFSLKSSKKRR